MRPIGARTYDPLEEYLSEMCAPLQEVMAREDVADFRRIAREHLEDLQAEYQNERGFAPIAALHSAFREHGDARQIGCLLRDEWAQGDPRLGRHPSLRPGAQGMLLLFTLLWGISLPAAIGTIGLLLLPLFAGAAVYVVARQHYGRLTWRRCLTPLALYMLLLVPAVWLTALLATSGSPVAQHRALLIYLVLLYGPLSALGAAGATALMVLRGRRSRQRLCHPR